MHQNFQTGRRPVARVLLFFYPRRWRRSGWALGALSRQEPLMEPPRRSWLPVPSNCPVSLRPLLHTASRSLSPHCALSIQLSPPPVCRMRLPLAPTRQSSPNYRCKSDPFFQAPFYLYPSLENHEENKRWAPSVPSEGSLCILSALFEVIPNQGCALTPADSVLHR